VNQRFEYRPRGRDVVRVDLFGESSDWRNPVGLDRETDGTFACVVDLPPGIYQYKFLTRLGDNEAEWSLDQDNPRTRSARGHQNSVIAIDGAPEPWLFAPSPPWITELERGGVRILVGARDARSSPRPEVHVEWSENGGATWSRTALAHAFDEDEHTFFVRDDPRLGAEARGSIGRRRRAAVRGSLHAYARGRTGRELVEASDRLRHLRRSLSSGGGSR